MRRHLPALFWILPLLAISGPVNAAITYYRIAAGANTANSENACPAWVPETNQDDCSYNASDPSGLGTDQWIGPVFSAGYYAPDAAPSADTLPQPLDGKSGIPIAAGFIAIDDGDTPANPANHVIFGTIEFGAFERNVATGSASRVVESFSRIIHRIIPPSGPIDDVGGATPNAGGGFDYIVGISGGLPVFPSILDDAFPSEVASQSSSDPADIPFWTAPAANGIARLEGVTRTTGTTTTASVWDYSCDAGTGPGTCEISARNEINWDAGTRARFDNVLLRISTDSSGQITAGAAFLVNESNLSAAIPGNDSWQATTLAFTGTSDSLPDAFDDRAFLTEGVATIDSAVLDNDATGAAPVTIAPPPPTVHGSAAVITNLNGTVVIRYSKDAADPFLGDVDIPYTISNGNGDTADAKLVVTITDPVTCTDDSPPSIAQNAVTPIDEFLVNDTGLDVPPITVSIAQPTFGTATLNLDNTITYTPPEDAGGLFTFRYSVREGALAASVPQCTISVRVSGPIANDDGQPIPIRTNLNTAVTVHVLDNDDDLVNPVVVSVESALNGTAVANPDNTITFTPTAGFTGRWPAPDCDPATCFPGGGGGFTYRITDANSESSVIVGATIDVLPPPVTDDGGSSAVDLELLALLLFSGVMRGRRQSLVPDRGKVHATYCF